jgi:hypothetical protein
MMNGSVWQCSTCEAQLPDDEYIETRKKKHLLMHKKKKDKVHAEAFKLKGRE